MRPLLLSMMLGLLEAMRQVDQREHERPAVRWVMQAPADASLWHPERCWFWGESPLAN